MQQVFSIILRQIDDFQGSPLPTQEHFNRAKTKACGSIFVSRDNAGNALIAGAKPGTAHPLIMHPRIYFFDNLLNSVVFGCAGVFQAPGLSLHVCLMSMVTDPCRESNQFVRPDVHLPFFESRS